MTEQEENPGAALSAAGRSNNSLDENGGSSDEDPENAGVGGGEQQQQQQQQNRSKPNVQALLRELEDRVDQEKRKYHRINICLWIGVVISLLLWFVIVPVSIAVAEDWTYQASWYYSIQAGFGVGFGALTVTTKGMEILLVIHLVFGAFSIAFLVSHLVSVAIDRADQKKKNLADVRAENLGQDRVAWRSWVRAAVLITAVFAAGILYGVLYEKWNFTESLYFIVSACQTSGLLAPTIRPKDPNNTFAPLFVALLVIVGVPLWAYTIGKCAVELVNLHRTQRRQTSVLERVRDAQAGLVRLAPVLDVDVSDLPSARVNLVGLLVQVLLFHKLANESMIRGVVEDYQELKEGDAVPQWKVIARVRFLQLEQLGLIESDQWAAFCEEARHVTDKSVIISGSMKSDPSAMLGASNSSINAE